MYIIKSLLASINITNQYIRLSIITQALKYKELGKRYKF